MKLWKIINKKNAQILKDNWLIMIRNNCFVEEKEKNSELQPHLNRHVEAFAVQWGDAIVGNGLLVLGRRITLVLLPMILRILRIVFLHQQITGGFRQDGSRRYGLIFSVAANYTDMFNIMIFVEAITVNQQELRTHL